MYTLRDILRFFTYHFRQIIWPLKRPPWPQNSDGRVYVHIGSGSLQDRRFINVDIQPYRTVHYLSDGKCIDMPSSSADLIYASHVLEHFSHRDIRFVLSEWHRILKPAGGILISVPDYSIISKIYYNTKDICSIKIFLMGSQANPFDFHHNIFDRASLNTLLIEEGFTNIEDWEPQDYSDYPFEDYAHYEPTRALSLNLKARKAASGACG